MNTTYTFSAKYSRRKINIILKSTRDYCPSDRVEAFNLAMEKHKAHQKRALIAHQKQVKAEVVW